MKTFGNLSDASQSHTLAGRTRQRTAQNQPKSAPVLTQKKKRIKSTKAQQSIKNIGQTRVSESLVLLRNLLLG
ncbi:MAG: hypothetical protein COA57_11130 [Flavobacteriales bacterium]|nr:MAG: hypothetical protein COA57_11130 [Flavobacteriales bacterium]